MSNRLGPTRLRTVTTADRWKSAVGRIEGKFLTIAMLNQQQSLDALDS